jgi:hypothetical protein
VFDFGITVLPNYKTKSSFERKQGSLSPSRQKNWKTKMNLAILSR